MQITPHSKALWIFSLLTITLGISYAANDYFKNNHNVSNLTQIEAKTISNTSINQAKPIPLNQGVETELSAQDIAQETPLVILGEDITTPHETPLPRLLSSYTQAGAELDTYLEEQDIGYLDSSYYPFDAQTEAALIRYASSGKILLFDNTEATENLLEFNKTSGDVVADYYGTGSESSMTIATSVKLANGGIEYMVLPVSASEQETEGNLSERVKLAIELFQQEQARKQEENANS